MKSITLPYCIAKVQLVGSPNTVCMPLHDREIMHVNVPTYMLAGKFANKFQEKILNTGSYDALLQYHLSGNFELRSTEVSFKASKEHLGFKHLTIRFDYGAQATNLGWWAVIPVLGIEAFADKEEGLEEAVQETIRLEFIRNKRLDLLQSVISTLWYESPEWISENIDLNTYTPAELENLKQEKQQQLLPKVAEKLVIHRQVLYGYEAELKQLAEALKSKYNRSVLLVGKSGIGKTTLVWELARQHHSLGINTSIWETTAATLIKELTGRTGWQDQLSLLCRECTQSGSVLFVRNMMELFEVGQYEGNSVSMGDYLRDYIGAGELTLLSECTEEELARIELRNPNYTALFQVIRIEEPKDEQVLEDIIRQKVQDIAKGQHISIELEAIRETIRLHRRYTPYSGFPGKPIRFLESILLNYKKMSKQWEIHKGTVKWTLDRGTIIRAFCEETGMPPFMVDPDIPMDMQQVSAFFHQQLFGQDDAIRTVVDMLASVKTALTRQGKPIASMLFVGPTGVGKTELAKVLAEFMFGSRDKMLRFDMSEYASPYAVTRLTGESYFSDGILTSAVRREPFCVLLFDEIEKADTMFNDLLLQLLGEGRLTDSQGKLVNFCSTIVIMTSNIGAQRLQTGGIGYEAEVSETDVTNHFQNEVRKYFRPEIFNRIDQIVSFYPLPLEVVRLVVDREIALLRKREGLSHRSVDFVISDSLYDWLCLKGYHPRYGARALQRALQEELIIPLSQKLNEYNFEDRLSLEVGLVADRPVFTLESDPLKLELILEELTHNEYMDYASELRMKAYRLKEGRSFVQMSSELTIMQNQKRHNEKQFWAKRENAENYANYLALQDNYLALRKEIDILEVDMALMGMELRPLNTHLYENLKQWEQRYNDYKLTLLEKIYPEYNTCYFAIYGGKGEFKRFWDIYNWMLQSKNYTVKSATSVWFRESLYNEIKTVKLQDLVNKGVDISPEDEAALEKDPAATITIEAKEYFRKPYYERDEDALDKEQKDDLFLGVEFILEGVGVQLFFNGEHGTHMIVGEEKTGNFRTYITSNADQHNVPLDLHRQNFFKVHRRPRRTYQQDHVEDSEMELGKREVLPPQQPKFMLDALDKIFAVKTDAILL